MAPRVLVDATAVPADRGGVGRYVDGLLGALGAAGTDLAIVCQRADAERYSQVAPQATMVPGPPAIAHRPARLAWEQTGLPLVAQQLAVDVIHSPHYTMPLRAGRPVVVTIHDATFFTPPDNFAPVMLGSDGRVWDGHHRICIAIQRCIPSLMVELAASEERAS